MTTQTTTPSQYNEIDTSQLVALKHLAELEEHHRGLAFTLFVAL